MCVLPFFITNALVLTLYGRVSAPMNIEPNVAFVPLAEPLRQKKLFRSYPDVVNYLLKKVANGQAIAETNSAILRYTQPTSMTLMQYAEDLYAKLCKAADVFDVHLQRHLHRSRQHVYLTQPPGVSGLQPAGQFHRYRLQGAVATRSLER